MKGAAADNVSLEVRAPLPEAGAIVNQIGLVFFNTERSYWLSAADKASAVRNSFELIEQGLKNCEEISFHSSGGNLKINGNDMELATLRMKSFVARLDAAGVSAFSLRRGLSCKVFEQLLEILTWSPQRLETEGGFPAVVTRLDLQCVSAPKITYREVAEDEVVIAREKLHHETEFRQGIAAITDFLKGGAATADPGTAESIRRIAANNPQKLGEIILDAASSRQGGSETGAVVADCLRRSYDGLLGDPAMKTQQGKKNLRKMLLLLEKDILERMSAGEQHTVSDADTEAITAAVKEMTDGLQIETLAAEYVKKRKAIDSSEKRIKRVMKMMGFHKLAGPEMRDKMVGLGLDPNDLQDLFAGEEDVADKCVAVPAIGNLALLITSLADSKIAGERKDGAEPGADAGSVIRIVDEVNKEVERIVSRSQRKIADLVKQLKDDDAAEQGAAKGTDGGLRKQTMSRKALLKMLAEFVQEFCQPLSVINCVVDTIAARSLGDVPSAYNELLALAADSGGKLKTLADNIEKIVGSPDTLSPDAPIQAALNQAVVLLTESEGSAKTERRCEAPGDKPDRS